MNQTGIKNPSADLSSIGFNTTKNVIWNLDPKSLAQTTVELNEGVYSDTGALCINTGTFTGRSPEDRFIVKDELTAQTVDWGNVNKAISPKVFDNLKTKMLAYFGDKDSYIKDAYACSHKDYQIHIRLIAEKPWSAQFAHNMFRRLNDEQIKTFMPHWHIICAPGFEADPEVDDTRSSNFVIINFTAKTILIGGTGYTGEIKKGIFSVLNYILVMESGVLPMHCSANVGEKGDTAVFFGLSGTGKTTLSADPQRALIGDDEHGWSDDSIFNFEGGCYAKCVGLTKDKEPDIYNAIKEGAILENIGFVMGTNKPDFENTLITENTRVSYPLEFISNAKPGSKGGVPKNIFFLTCDAFGVLPPISKLTPGQAMFHFISGYTAKVAGTEVGVIEPKATFSACFGAPFMPLHPTQYADMLGKKMTDNDTKVWLINTGWSGGSYGQAERINLKYTRTMITAALNGDFDQVDFKINEIFGLAMPTSCPHVPTEILDPREAWVDKIDYDKKANHLAELFQSNFKKYADQASDAILDAMPKVLV